MSKLPPQRGSTPKAVGWWSAFRDCIVALGFLLGLAAAGCGQVDGKSGLFPGTVLYQSPGSEFEFNLLEPPWRETVTSSETIFVVPSKILTLLPTEEGALYSLHIYRQNTDAATALQADAPARLPNEGSTGPSNVTSGTGSTGLEMSWKEAASVYHRDAYVTIATGQTFRLHFSAATPLGDDNMITQMIASFRPVAAGGG